MTGTFINIVTVLVGGTLGLVFGAALPARINKTIVAGVGLFTVAIGVKMFLETSNLIIVLCSILVGGVLGELWRIEARLNGVGSWLEDRFSDGTRKPSLDFSDNLTPVSDTLPSAAPQAGEKYRLDEKNGASTRFVKGFLTASLVFCVGPLTILGSIQDGLTGDYSLLAIKSVLDGFAGLAFASTLGLGVLFSVLVILVYQGGLSLLAFQAQALITPAMMDEMTAVGGVLLLGLAVSSLLEIKPIRVGNFLPALVIAPLITGILSAFGLL